MKNLLNYIVEFVINYLFKYFRYFLKLKLKKMFKQLLFDAIKSGCTVELTALLEKFKEKNGEEKYLQLKNAIQNSFTLLKSVTDETKTKLDDTLVGIVLDSIKNAD